MSLDFGGSAALGGAWIEANVAGGDGGAVFAQQAHLSTSGSVFRHNIATDGGGIFVQVASVHNLLLGPAPPQDAMKIELVNTTLDSNAAACGGAAVTIKARAELAMVDCTVNGDSGDMGALLSGAAAMSANADSLRDGLSKAATQCSEKDEEVYIWLDSCHGSGLISEQAVHASIPTGATLVQSTTCSDSSVPMWVIYMLTSMLVSLVGILVVALCMHVARTARLKNQLLSKALPPDIAKRLLLGEKVVDSYEHAAIVFADIVGYTAYSSTVTAEELVHLLDTFFNRLDIECEECNCLKVVATQFLR
eukprot:scaffold723_cov363-Prasinococcus_capsulatus_cf.AAC.9